MPTKVLKLDSVPTLPRKAMQTALDESLVHGHAMTRQLKRFYSPILRDYREELIGHFNSYFKDEDPKTKEAVWNVVEARRRHSYQLLSESFSDLVDSADTEVETLMDEDLTDELEEGFNYGLWTLHQSGINVSEAQDIGDFDKRKAILIAAGIAGASYADRILTAGAVAKQRFSTWLRATIAGGRPLKDTLEGYDQITHAYTTRVSLLGENENHRSMILGVREASKQYNDRLIGSVWLTQNPTPCPICVSKNLIITSQLPISHSHPGCRCIKVPIVLDFNGNPVNYVEFLQSIGRR